MAGFLLAEGALLECMMGLAPSPLNVLPINGVVADFMPVANIMDHIPFLNIVPFGMCKSPANPAVAAIIASSLGAVTQGPCIPMTVAPWLPGDPTLIIGEFPSVDLSSKAICNWGGVISVAGFTGQFAIMDA